MALTELEFYEYFLSHDEELRRTKKALIRRLKSDIMDTVAYDMLRVINARIDERVTIYNDLKRYFHDREIEEYMQYMSRE